MTIETQKSLNESDRFRTPHSTHVEGVVGRSAAALCGAHSVNQGTAAVSAGTGFRSLTRSILSVLAAGGSGRWRLGDGKNLWAFRTVSTDDVTVDDTVFFPR